MTLHDEGNDAIHTTLQDEGNGTLYMTLHNEGNGATRYHEVYHIYHEIDEFPDEWINAKTSHSQVLYKNTKDKSKINLKNL